MRRAANKDTRIVVRSKHADMIEIMRRCAVSCHVTHDTVGARFFAAIMLRLACK